MISKNSNDIQIADDVVIYTSDKTFEKCSDKFKVQFIKIQQWWYEI